MKGNVESTKISSDVFIIVAFILHAQMWVSLIVSHYIFLASLIITGLVCSIVPLFGYDKQTLNKIVQRDINDHFKIIFAFQEILLISVISVSSAMMVKINMYGDLGYHSAIMFQIIMICAASLSSTLCACFIENSNYDIISSNIDNKSAYCQAILLKGSKCCPYSDDIQRSDAGTITVLRNVAIKLAPGTKFLLNELTYYVGTINNNNMVDNGKILLSKGTKIKSNLSTDTFATKLRNDDYCVLDKNTKVTLPNETIINDGVTEFMLQHDTTVSI